MTTNTTNLGLFKYNTIDDANLAFSIDDALNYNWDIIDEFSQSVSNQSALGENGWVLFNNGLLINYGTVYTGTQEVSWTQPVLSADGDLGGNSFAIYPASVTTSGSGYKGFKAFDKNTSTMWLSNTNRLYPERVCMTIYNPESLKITNIKMRNRNINNATILTGNIQVSDDNITYTTIKTFTNDVIAKDAEWNIDLSDNIGFYKYYKIQPSSVSNNGSYAIGFSEITLTATYVTSGLNSITFPKAHNNTTYAYALSFFNGIMGNSYVNSISSTGMTLQENSNASKIYYITIGY